MIAAEGIYRGRGWASPSRLCPQISDSCHHSHGSDLSRGMFHSEAASVFLLRCNKEEVLSLWLLMVWHCISPGLMAGDGVVCGPFMELLRIKRLYSSSSLPAAPQGCFLSSGFWSISLCFGLPNPYYSNSLLLLFLAVLLPLVRYSAAKLQHWRWSFSNILPVCCDNFCNLW